jgi:SH3-like domain-containing protein
MCVWKFFGVCLLSSSAFVSSATNVDPYSVTIKAREANVRVGPGSRYPLAWKFTRPGLPLMVVAEVGTWRKIRDVEEAEGWIHQNMIVRRRTVVVTGQRQVLMNKPDPNASVLAYIESGVCARLLEIRGNWVRVRVEDLSGWLPRAHVWGVSEEEKEGRF